MALQKGDFILIDYVAKVKETNEVFDTTKDDVAKKEHLHKEGQIHEPELVVVGEGWVLKALDDALTTMEIKQAMQPLKFHPTKASDKETQKKSNVSQSNNSTQKKSTPSSEHA